MRSLNYSHRVSLATRAAISQLLCCDKWKKLWDRFSRVRLTEKHDRRDPADALQPVLLIKVHLKFKRKNTFQLIVRNIFFIYLDPITAH